MPTQDPKGGDGDGAILPEWFPTSFGGFRNLVVGVVSSWFILGVLNVLESIVDSILVVYRILQEMGSTIGSSVVSVGSTVGSVPMIVLGIVESTLVTIGASAGPAAPIVVGFIASIVLVALILTARAILTVMLGVFGRVGAVVRRAVQ